MRPKPEIILFGKEEGTSEICQELGLRYEPTLARNEFGTPLMGDLFERGQMLANSDLVCYVNSDIILMSDFMRAIEQLVQLKPRFVMVGQRWNLDVREPIDFGLQWEKKLRARVMQNGHLFAKDAIDFFVFPKVLRLEMPAFACGRTVWDNWLLYRARFLRVPLIDVTRVVMVVHQNHDYSFYPKGREGIQHGPEAKCNFELAGGWPHLFSLHDALYLLTPRGLKFATDFWHLSRYAQTLPMFYHYLRPPCWLLSKITGLYWRIFIRRKLFLDKKT